MNKIEWSDFEKIDLRIGTIIRASHFEKAIKPALILEIDFGEFGVKKTTAQITKGYHPENLIGTQVSAVINFPPKQIANIMSECLILGGVNGEDVTLISPRKPVPNGTKIG